MEFIYRIIAWRCNCGFSPSAVRVGVTSNGQLIGIWNCNCGNEVKALIPFEQLIADIPTPVIEGFSEADKTLMSKAHISLD